MRSSRPLTRAASARRSWRVSDRLAGEGGQSPPPGRERADRPAAELGLVGDRRRVPAGRRLATGHGSAGLVGGEEAERVGRADPVHHRVVDPEHQRLASVVEAVDEGGVPQRPVEGQLLGGQVAAEPVEVRPARRSVASPRWRSRSKWGSWHHRYRPGSRWERTARVRDRGWRPSRGPIGGPDVVEGEGPAPAGGVEEQTLERVGGRLGAEVEVRGVVATEVLQHRRARYP